MQEDLTKVNEKLCDDLFHVLFNSIEYYCKEAPSLVKTSLTMYSDDELQELLWEVVEEHGRNPTCRELRECFEDALDYADKLYGIRRYKEFEESFGEV